MNIILIDYDISGFKRYAKSLCSFIRSQIDDLSLIGIYVNEKSKISIDSIDKFIQLNETKYDINRVFDKVQPAAIIVFAHRLLEYMFVIEAKRRNIKVFNFQHGIYMEHTSITSLNNKSIISIFKNKYEKLNVYFKCLYQICDKKIFNTTKLCLKLVRGKNMYEVINKEFGNLSSSDVSFVYGQYWEDYYKTHYYDYSKRFCVIGYPELEQDTCEIGKNLFKDSSLPLACYLAQTSVEDGIISQDILSSFLSCLKSLGNKVNIVIKLHPRSNKELYSSLFCSENIVFWENNCFPKADMYIGHESTTIARAMFITDKTLIYKLIDNNNNIFLKYAKYIASNQNEFNTVIEKMLVEKNEGVCAEKLKECVNFNESRGAIQMTADIITDYLTNANI